MDTPSDRRVADPSCSTDDVPWLRGLRRGRDRQEVRKWILTALDIVFSASEKLRPHLSEDQFLVVAVVLAEAATELDMGVLDAIYREYPDLRPANMRLTFTLSEMDEME
jgi:hypothetical protein